MHIYQIEEQTPDSLLIALEGMEKLGITDYNDQESELLKTVRMAVDRHEFLTVAVHNSLVQLAIRYL